MDGEADRFQRNVVGDKLRIRSESFNDRDEYELIKETEDDGTVSSKDGKVSGRVRGEGQKGGLPIVVIWQGWQASAYLRARAPFRGNWSSSRPIRSRLPCDAFRELNTPHSWRSKLLC